MTCRVQSATRQRKPRSTRVLASQRHTIICQKICGNYVCEVAVPQCYQRPGNRDQLVNLYWAMSLIKMHYDIWELCPRTAEDVEAVGSVNVPVSLRSIWELELSSCELDCFVFSFLSSSRWILVYYGYMTQFSTKGNWKDLLFHKTISIK